MKRKKIVMLLVSVPVVLALGAGISLAYFTDKAEKENVMVMGNVDIELEEPNYKPDETSKKTENIVPGDIIKKDPTVIVKAGSENCYIRAVVKYDGLNENQIADLQEGMKYNGDWFKVDATGDVSTDIWYYKNEINKGSVDQRFMLFEQVVIPTTWGNEIASKEFKINVTGQAIQAKNFTPTKDATGNIVGWGDAWTEGNQ